VFDEKHFYKTLWQLAIPITIQQVVTASLGLVDTVMVGQLGAVEVAAVGLANRFYNILALILFALSSGTAIFTAQFWGKKDLHLIGKPMGMALVCSIVSAFLFSLLAIFTPGEIMRVFTKDTAVIQAGSVYLRIVAFSYVLTAVTAIYSGVLRSIEHVKLPMFASTSALGLNTLLNYGLILGHFGLPALGVKGAAIATLIARILEAAIIVLVTSGQRYPAIPSFDLTTMPSAFIKQFFRITAPVVVNESLWVLGVTVYPIVYGRMGTADIAAVNMTAPVEQIAFAFFAGLFHGSAVMIGNQIGAGRNETAFAYAQKVMFLGPLGALIAGGMIFVSASGIVTLFHVSPEVQSLAVHIFSVISCLYWIKIFNCIAAVSIFRSGGDTIYALYWDVGPTWLIGVPLALLSGFVWKLPVYWVFALTYAEEVARMILALQRIYSKKWIHNLASHDIAAQVTK
jgi:putative MATE family efflux protein